MHGSIPGSSPGTCMTVAPIVDRGLPSIHSPGQHLFAAKSVDYVFDHLDPEAGAGGWIDPSVDMSERLGHQVVLHRIAQRLQLEQLASGRVERNRQTRRRYDRGRPRMGVRLPAIELAALRDLLETGDPLP